VLVPTDAATQSHPAACERDRVQRLLQQQTRSSSLLQLDMDTKQVRFDPLAREIDPELLKVQAWQESAGSTNAGSTSQVSANTLGQPLPASMAPSGSRNGSGSRSSSTNETSGIGSGRAHGVNKELPSWDSGRSVHVKVQALWRHVNSALLSARRFRVNLGSGSGGLLLNIGCVVLATAGIALFIFCIFAQYSDELPNLGTEKQVKKRAAGTCWTGPEPSPRETLESSHDLATTWQRSAVSSSRTLLALKTPWPMPEEATGLRSAVSVTSAFDTSQSSARLSVVPPDPGQHPACSLDALRSPPRVLCEGLVVPAGCECTLLVPRIKPTYANCEATINDVAHIPVFTVVFCRPAFPTGVHASIECDGDRCLALCSISEEGTPLAYCRSSFNNALGIFNADHVQFGLVRKRTGQLAGLFEVITQAGFDLHLSENRFGDVIISDKHGQTVAWMEPHPPEPEFRLFRIGPNCDAGLATLCVLVIDLLKAATEAGREFPGKGRHCA